MYGQLKFNDLDRLVEKPEEMVARNCGHTFSVQVNLGTEETERFTRWLDNRAVMVTDMINKTHSVRQDSTSCKNSVSTKSATALLLLLLLSGKDDKCSQ